LLHILVYHPNRWVYKLSMKKTFELAVQNHQKNNLEVAQKLYNEILQKNPNHAGANSNLGIIFKGLGKIEEARSCYEKAIEINPNHANAHNNLGNLLKDLGEIEKAKACYEKAIEINPKDANAHDNLGTIFVKLNEFQKAKSCLEKVIEINPNHTDAYNNLGTVFLELGEIEKAKSCYEKATEINPNHADAHNNLGIIFKQLEEIEKAKSCYEKAIEINPNHSDAHGNLGVIFKQLRELQKAKACYKKAIEINPNHADAHSNLGVVFFDELGDLKKSKSCYERAIEINPNHADAHNNLGVVYNELEENQKAISHFEKASQIKPNSISVRKNIASYYISRLDNYEKAINYSHMALKTKKESTKFTNQIISSFKLKHDVQQAKYLSSKNYKLKGIDAFQKIGEEILNRKENKFNKNILLNQDEIKALLPFYNESFVYKPKVISESCINPNKNWLKIEDEYLNSSNQIMYIDDFLSDEAIKELREFSLVSKVWNSLYQNKYLGAFSDIGFSSTIHLQIANDLKEKLPKLFGPHRLGKFWGFKYDSTLGKGINIHADAAIHNLNFWITPDEYNNNKNSGGLKVYDVPSPDNWTFNDYNASYSGDKIHNFLNDNNANCTNVPYKFNRAVLFNSAYFHETDEIDFKDEYEGRRINNTYLFGIRIVKKN
jgi:tetratricopeptide (TPR) repeat protein